MGGGGKTRLNEKRELRAEAILDAAFTLLERDGLEALTLQRVARSLDYVPAALYRYFGSKDGLLAALQRRAVTTLHQSFRAEQAALEGRVRRASAPVAALARLVGAARFYLALPRSHRELWFLVASLLGDPRPLVADDEARGTAPLLLAFLADVDSLFSAAEAVGALSRGDHGERTLAFWASLQGALTLEKARRLAPHVPGAQRIGGVAAQALLLGWGAEQSLLGRAMRLVPDGDDSSSHGEHGEQ